MAKKRLVGFLGSCGTPYCGGIIGYFCVRCHRYVSDCRCSPASCACHDSKGWACAGERPAVRAALAAGGGKR